MQQDNTARNALIIGAAFLVSLFVISSVVGPLYNVWAQSLDGKAELQKAEYTRQVAVLEAQAKKDSAQQLADAEIIRATGVAKANQIIEAYKQGCRAVMVAMGTGRGPWVHDL